MVKPGYLDVGEGFPAMPVRRWVNADKGCPPEQRFMVQVHLARKSRDSKRKIYAWRNTVRFSFEGRDFDACMAEANRFMLAEFRKQARLAGAKKKRAQGRTRQAARKRENRSRGRGKED